MIKFLPKGLPTFFEDEYINENNESHNVNENNVASSPNLEDMHQRIVNRV
jgi:hypothetical protein